jgi:hypothetical protein
MDVLELPRPVINFLRTMAKEGCRYVLSWDIFGGSDAVTLTLTWKLNDDQSLPEQVHDDRPIRHTDSISLPRRSRRDINVSASAIFRSSRGKSLDDHNQIANKPIVCHPSHVSSLERSSIIHRQKKESDPIYANLSHMKYNTNPSPSFLANNNSPLSIASTHQRQTKQQYDTPTIRKSTPSKPTDNNIYSKLKRINHIATRNDDDDDDDNIHDPWVKRLDYSVEDNTPDTVRKSDDDIDKIGITSGKVKFKRKPDYF